MSLEEDNGLFGFDFDDEDFVTKEKEKVIVAHVDYEARVETDGWFHDQDKSLDQLMLEQLGPNQVRSAIEHNYFYKRYDRALTDSLEFIHIANTNSNCKVSNTKEITDIAMHCAAKLGKLDMLDDLLKNKSHTQDTGLYLLRAKFYPLIGRYTEAMEACVSYHQERKLDYRVWSMMADIFMKSACRNPIGDRSKEMRYHLANLSMQRAIHIINTSSWRNNIDFVKARFDKDLDGLKNRLKESVNQGGDADEFAAWMLTNPDKSQGGLNEFAWEDIEWIYKDWVLRQDIELDSEVKAVKDL